MPRLLRALLAGALLAVSGVAMQSVVRNPLRYPEVLGVTQGASHAVRVVDVAADGSCDARGGRADRRRLSLAVTLALNHRYRHAPLAVALTGIVIGAPGTTLAQWLITQESVQPARFVVWLVGGTYGRSWGEVSMLLPWCVLAVPVFACLAKPLDMLALRRRPYRRARLAGGCTPAARADDRDARRMRGRRGGRPVGFIGLMAPHVATMLARAGTGRGCGSRPVAR